MGIYDLYSSRQKKLRGEIPDVYQYEVIDNKLRVQIVHIIKDVIGDEFVGSDIGGEIFNQPSAETYQTIYETLCREYGLLKLTEDEDEDSNCDAVYNFFLALGEDDIETCLDIIELSFFFIDTDVKKHFKKNKSQYKQSPKKAIEELNHRFKVAGVGYQFESGKIIKIDSQFVHAEVVKPVLQLLGKDEIYSGANNEFLSAHEHYRRKKYKECLVDCLKSFESLIKAICDKQKWDYKSTDNIGRLINVCFSNNLVPSYMQSQFESIKSLFVSGVPVIRNKSAGHGQGATVITIPEHLASYTLHLTATNLLFLAKCEMDLNGK